MRTFLLTWNPDRWQWHDVEEVRAAVSAGTSSAQRAWSTGRRTDIRTGERLFLLRLGSEPRGIVGSGHAAS